LTMVSPDLSALVAGVQRLSESFHPDDPTYQELVDTSITMAESYLEGMPGETEDDPYLTALRAYQVKALLSDFQFD